MTFLSFSAALLYFEQLDQLFHLYTPDEVQERAKKQGLMHVTPEDGVRLIEVPFTRATHPILSRMLNSGASTAINAQNAQHQAEERTRCTHVYDKATLRQRDVLRAFAKGLMPQQVMEELTITLPTVHNHKSALLNLCHEAWKIPEQQRLDYHFLQTRFATYFQSDG
jgi:CRISPR-associated protein Csx14